MFLQNVLKSFEERKQSHNSSSEDEDTNDNGEKIDDHLYQ